MQIHVPEVVGLLVLFCLDFVAIGTEALDCTNGRMFGQHICLKKGDYPTTQTNAQSACERDGGKLVAIGDSSKQQAVEEMMRNEGISRVWLGLTDKSSEVWMWAYSQLEIMPQGCFTDRSTGNRDLPYSAGLQADQVSIESCTAKCKELEWEYAGTQMGSQCWCGRDFGNNGNTLITDCRVTCQGNALQYCGGSRKNYIYRTDGAYGIWMQSQPNNHDGSQWCAAMDSTADYKFADEPCDREVYFVCNMPANTACNREVKKQGRFIEVDNVCYFLSYYLKNWFAAQNECWNKGGKLVELASAKEHEDLGKVITSYSERLINYYWIGLQKRNLNWPDGSSMTYSNFKVGSPNKYFDTCFKMEKSDEYKWVNVECSERHDFICQYDGTPFRRHVLALVKLKQEVDGIVTSTNEPTTTEQKTTALIATTGVSTTVASTTASSTTQRPASSTTKQTASSTTQRPASSATQTTSSIPTTPASTTTTTSSSISSTKTSTISTTLGSRSTTVVIVTPSAAAKSIDDEGFDYNGLFISLIVLVSLLIIIVIAAILYMVYLKKKNKRQAVHPDRSYDVKDFENKYLSTPKTVADSNPYSSIHANSTGLKSQQGHVSTGKIMIED